MSGDSKKLKIMWKLLAIRLFVGCIITVYMPYLILSSHPTPLSLNALTIIGVIFITMAVIFYFRCVWDFAFIGQADNPNIIVASGTYKFVRNPMYISLVLILLSESLIFRSERLLGYAFGFWICIHLLVILYEERSLRKKFGTLYEKYCKEVPRWIPNFRKA